MSETYKPARIWASCTMDPETYELTHTEWHDDEDEVLDVDVEYVRADLVAPDIAKGENHMTKRTTYRGKEIADMNRAELIATIRSMEAFHNSAEDQIGLCSDLIIEGREALEAAQRRIDEIREAKPREKSGFSAFAVWALAIALFALEAFSNG